MDSSNLYSLLEMISDRGWQHLSNIIDEIDQSLELNLSFKPTETKLLPFSNKELSFNLPSSKIIHLKKNEFRSPLKENPYSNDVFKDSGLDPYAGFFKKPRSTMHNAYNEAYKDSGTIKVDGKFLELQCIIYAHYKLPISIVRNMIIGYLAMTTLLKKPAYGNGPNVLASVNGLKIALMPDLKLATNFSGADAFGMYYFGGKLDYILMNSSIKDDIIDDFNQATREKMWKFAETNIALPPKFPAEEILNAKAAIMLITVTMLHELGHRVEKKCLDKQQAELHNFWTKYKKNDAISKYGVISPKEWFAECWAAWVIDGLSYSEKVKIDFLKLLFPPKNQNTSLEVLMTSGEPFNYDTIKNIFDQANVTPGARFKLQITYDVGPSLEIVGTLIKIIQHEIPTIKYDDGSDSKKILNFFPNRRIVSIKCGKL